MVEVLDETARFPHPERIERALAALLDESGLTERDVTVVLVDDAVIQRYNRNLRGVDAPTDVLSFPTHEPDDVKMPRVSHLGDIMIGLETAARQAETAGTGLLDEVLTLAAHGLTHLRGFDHPTEEAWQIFRTAQARILALDQNAG